ncbi:hypothetical protein [Streptomyces sp. NBC_00233]|uniref:hypothetical protein n=1 Tax=Streptomyces sp. NBC_00233 TaxID=2975686 RepID=UPI00224CB02A|nr:hypothetical protein [Streptomyces sp. NBC_00233]MCX5231469.1 hypothetical protein [Streptomyces sp. NBC_00233]MCX5233143.1 hypothetical protein [Streptomyces sp. NBC_00233]MCX5233585.1 hypothetical protein [Streptomyces sp. NBC_00233]
MTVGVALVVGARRFPLASAVLDRVCVMDAVWHVQDADRYVVDAEVCAMDAPGLHQLAYEAHAFDPFANSCVHLAH